jgi:hypothetical protein
MPHLRSKTSMATHQRAPGHVPVVIRFSLLHSVQRKVQVQESVKLNAVLDDLKRAESMKTAGWSCPLEHSEASRHESDNQPDWIGCRFGLLVRLFGLFMPAMAPCLTLSATTMRSLSSVRIRSRHGPSDNARTGTAEQVDLTGSHQAGK